MYDLKKVEENFHDMMRSVFSEKVMARVEFPELTEKLLKNQSAIDFPGTFGSFFYFLAIEDEKPILYVNAVSRMDLDFERLCIVDEQSFEWIEDGNYTQIREEKGVSRKVII